MIIHSDSGILNLQPDLMIKPGMSFLDLPKEVGQLKVGFLSIPLCWDFSNMPWFAGLHESKKFFRRRISQIYLGPDPYPENTSLEEANREEEKAFAQQEFLKKELGNPHECRGEAAHYLGNPVFVYWAYEYRWGRVSCEWDPKNMLSTPIKIEYF